MALAIGWLLPTVQISEQPSLCALLKDLSPDTLCLIILFYPLHSKNHDAEFSLGIPLALYCLECKLQGAGACASLHPPVSPEPRTVPGMWQVPDTHLMNEEANQRK